MEELDFDPSDGVVEDDGEESDASYLDEEEKAELDRIFRSSRESYVMKEGVDSVSGQRRKTAKGMGELDALLKETDAALNKIATSEVDDTTPSVNGMKHSKKSKSGSKKSASRTSFDLVEPTFVPSKETSARWEDSGLEAYGEATALSMVDNTDKKTRKRSLRFHTSKIESSARRREESREKLGGTSLPLALCFIMTRRYQAMTIFLIGSVRRKRKRVCVGKSKRGAVKVVKIWTLTLPRARV